METPQQQQPKKRGRPKGSSAKSKEDRDREPPHSAGTTTPRMRGPGADKKSGGAAADEKYVQWKSLVPVLYDWFANHNLVWPSLSCRYDAVLTFIFFIPPLFSASAFGRISVGVCDRKPYSSWSAPRCSLFLLASVYMLLWVLVKSCRAICVRIMAFFSHAFVRMRCVSLWSVAIWW